MIPSRNLHQLTTTISLTTNIFARFGTLPQNSITMHFATTLFAAVLALLPSMQAEIPSGNWMQLDCYVGYVYMNGQLLDTNHNLHYDWQLTAQACNNNYASSVVCTSMT